jgi:hypothetical protein
LKLTYDFLMMVTQVVSGEQKEPKHDSQNQQRSRLPDKGQH